MQTFSQNDKQLQGTPGAIAVLHTHTRKLDYHPHVHLVMPAAAVNREKKQWRTRRRSKATGGYLFNHKALAKVFRAKLLSAIEAAGLRLPDRYPAAWVVDCKSVGTGEKALVYLGRYLYRASSPRKTSSPAPTAKSASVIATPVPESWSAERFPARSSSGWCCSMCCPRDSRRARNFGFLHPNCKRLIALLHLLRKFAPGQAMAWVKQRAPILCDCCGAVMVIVRTRIRPGFAGPPPVPIVTRGAQ